MNPNNVRELTEVSAYARNESWVPRDSKHKICTHTMFLKAKKKSQYKIFVSKPSNLFPFNLTNFFYESFMNFYTHNKNFFEHHIFEFLRQNLKSVTS